MKRFAFLACLGILISGAAILAQQKGSAEQELIKLEEEWANANVKADVAFLDRILAADWTWTDADGVMWSKTESLAVLKSGQDKVASMVVDDMKVRVYGNTAVVTGRTTIKETMKGRDVSGVFRFTDTWIKMAGPQAQMPGGVAVVATPRWHCVATHASKVTGK